MSSEYPVVVYGASGYTGRLVMEHLRDLDVPFVAVGRNREKIEANLAMVPGIENARYTIELCENNVEDLKKVFKGRKVVCNTVGPFMRWGPPVLEACLSEGLHYVDTTGEQHWVKHLMDDIGPEFAKAGLALIPSLACMYGLSEIGARYCLEHPGVDSLDLTEVADAVPTVASAQTIFDAVRYSSSYLKDNELVQYPEIENGQIISPSGRVLMASNWGGTSHPIWFSRDGRVRNCKMSVAMWNQEIWKKEKGLERTYKVAFQWVPQEQLYPMLDQLAKDLTPMTPPRERRQVHRAYDVCLGTGNGCMVKATTISVGGYYTTGMLQAYGASRLARGPEHKVGFQSPSEAFGHRHLLAALESYGYAKINVEEIVV
jgi:short subunit dehydrogenase-like uncharacterized protein